MRAKWLLGMLGAGLPPLLAAAAASSAELPDWSGLWHVKGSVALISSPVGRMFVRGTADDAPLKPEFAAHYKNDLRRALEQGDPSAKDVLTDTNTLYCFAGFPRILAAPFNCRISPD